MRCFAVALCVCVAVGCQPPRPVSDAGPAAESEGESEGASGEGEPPAAVSLLGTACSVDADCGVGGACDDNGPLPATCTFACAQNEDCPQTFGQTLCDGHACSFRCQSSRDCPPGGECEIATCTFPHQCTTDADCGVDARCEPAFPSNDEYVCTLASLLGAVAVGDPCDPTKALLNQENLRCSASSDCPDDLICDPDFKSCALPLAQTCTLFCWPEGVCAGPCDTDAQCPSGMKCEGEFGSSLRVCAPFDGSGEHCKLDADCIHPGEKCTLRVDADRNVGLCAKPPADAVGYGELCGDDLSTANVIEPTRPCDTEVCLLESCGARCETDADCPVGACIAFSVAANAPDEHVCLAYPLCASDDDCAAGSACDEVVDAQGRFLTYCGRTPNLLADGANCAPFPNVIAANHHPCTTNGDCVAAFGTAAACVEGLHECGTSPSESCRSGLCTPEGICSTDCTADDQCPIGMQCELTPHTLDDGTTIPNSGCVVAIGSLTVCAHDADCTTAGEVCRLTFELDGTVDGRCAAPPAGSVAPHAQCNDGSKDARFPRDPACSTNACDDNGDCDALCTSDADCAVPLTCSSQPVRAPFGGDEVFVSICQ